MGNIAKLVAVCSLLISTLTSAYVNAGMYVNSGKLYEGNGTEFVMRGVNHAHTWYANRLEQSLQDIASTKANTVRIVLSNGHRWNRTSVSEVERIIRRAKAHHLITVLEVHDTTGYMEEQSAASIASAVDYWLSIKEALIGQEDYVIINIGNEPFGNGFDQARWEADHEEAIARLRSAGLTHTLMIDAPNWGQDWKYVMRDNAADLFAKDPQKNLVFSVHMYQLFNNWSTVFNYLNSFINKSLPIVIGEFAATHQGSNVDVESILSLAESNHLGYLGWSWSGNDASNSALDIVNNWNVNSLSSWGEFLVNSENGIRATSQPATIFAGTTTETETGTPICASADSDPDGDGWGWENEQSCIVDDTSSEGSGTPMCASADSDPDGDGWGWENEQSCIVDTSTPATPSCEFIGSDPDGDGWGWENEQSCIVDETSVEGGGTPICASADSDPDGDGWGWENEQSCIVDTTDTQPPSCEFIGSDPDGDGWGWENEQSCIVDETSVEGGGTPICASADSDPDGDGWGWENEQSCIVSTSN